MLAFVNLIILTYLYFFREKAVKIGCIYWLLAVNMYAFSVYLDEKNLKPVLNKIRRKMLRDLGRTDGKE